MSNYTEWEVRGTALTMRQALQLVVSRARSEARRGAPGRMVALYVEAEARHILADHHVRYGIPFGVDCVECTEALTPLDATSNDWPD